jgi:hypothetical protein
MENKDELDISGIQNEENEDPIFTEEELKMMDFNQEKGEREEEEFGNFIHREEEITLEEYPHTFFQKIKHFLKFLGPAVLISVGYIVNYKKLKIRIQEIGQQV